MKKYIHISSIILAVFVTACSSIETETTTLVNDAKVMHINPCITMQPSSRVSAPSANTFVFDEQDSIGISIVDKGTSLVGTENTNFNTKFTRTNGAWQQEIQAYWLNDAEGTQNDIIGYYPYVANINQPTALPLDLATDQSTIKQMSQCDYLWGRKTVTKTSNNAPVSLQMGHIMTKVTFNVKLSEGYASYKGIEYLQIASRTHLSLNLNSGIVSANGDFSSITPHKKDQNSEEFCQTYEAIIAPQKYSEDTFISFTFAGKKYSQPFAHSLLQGKHYTFLISLNEDKAPTLLLVSEININDWQTGETNDETITTIPQYKVGDLWPNEESPIAIVLSERIDNDHPGILMTLSKEESRIVEYSNDDKIFANIFTSSSGKVNMKRLKDYITKNKLSLNNFPAIKACIALGNEWFIPTYKELEEAMGNYYDYKDQEGWFKYIGSSGRYVNILTLSFDDSSTHYIIGSFYTAIGEGWSYGEMYSKTTSYAQMRAFRYY